MAGNIMARILAAPVLLAVAMSGGAALAGEADIVGATARRSGDTWSFSVTVRHADTGWEHYADRWDVVAPDGTVLASRTLLHPHVGEQPFIRSLGNVTVPDGVTRVIIRAHDTVHNLGGAELVLDLPTDKGS